MASLFEERALLDLVRGLKTLSGGCKGQEGDRNKSDNSFRRVSGWVGIGGGGC